MSVFLPNGLGQSTGDSLAVNKPLQVSGNVWYVHNTGSDAYNGRDATKPLATIGQAYTNASDYDIVVLKDGHAETRTTALTISKSLLIVGGGTSGGKPTVKITNNSAAASLFIIDDPAIQIRNVWINANAQTNAASRIKVQDEHFQMIGCYVECGATDTGTAVELVSGDANACVFKTTTFISTATVVTAQPESAVKISGAGTVLHLYFQDVTVSGGTVGWSNFYAIDLSSGTLTHLKGENTNLLLGSDVNIASAATGIFSLGTVTGGSRVNW